jgi:ABC-type antimicrobial peptide transport system permease subunit
MNLWQAFLQDPVIFFSFTGLAIVIGLCIFYAVYFVYKVEYEHLDGK